MLQFVTMGVSAVRRWDESVYIPQSSSSLLEHSNITKNHVKLSFFAHPSATSSPVENVEKQGAKEDDMEAEEIGEWTRWILGGGKEGRVSIWTLRTSGHLPSDGYETSARHH
jgi:hypothetical protein